MTIIEEAVGGTVGYTKHRSEQRLILVCSRAQAELLASVNYKHECSVELIKACFGYRLAGAIALFKVRRLE